MTKLFLTFLVSTTFISTTAHTQAYKRKTVMPQYFIPKEDIIKKEKLENIQRPVANVSAAYNKTMEQTKQKQIDFANTPEYTQIYDEYIKDINHISKTNTYPDTKLIEEDFSGMHTNEHFLIP